MFKLIKTHIYPHSVLYAEGELPEAILKRLKSLKLKISRADSKQIREDQEEDGYSLQLKNGDVVLWMRYAPRNPLRVAQLAHECFHTTDFILGDIGMKVSDKSDEAYAYLIQYLMEEILRRK